MGLRPVAVLSSLWLAGCSVFGISDVKEPPYTALARLGHVEIRQYAARVVAETRVQAEQVAARSVGFRRLAGYIFGGNQSGASIAMTAPVAQVSEAGGAWRILFFMPAGATLQSLPSPRAGAVRLTELPAQTYAVLRFSGIASPGAVSRQTAQLLAALADSAWHPAGEPVTWFYDPPWTLPPLRRNEVAVVVAPGQ